MSMHRIDLYGEIHKGLRNLIGGFTLGAGATDWNSDVDTDRLLNQWGIVYRLLISHHDHEDEFIHPLLARVAHGGHREYQQDHETQRVVLDDLDSYLRELADRGMPCSMRAERGREFYRASNVFYAGFLRHMAREETEAQRLLDTLCEQEELAATQAAIIGSIPLDELLLDIDYMFPAMNLTECAGLLAGVRTGAPPEVYCMLAERVRKALGDARWSELEQLLDTHGD